MVPPNLQYQLRHLSQLLASRECKEWVKSHRDGRHDYNFSIKSGGDATWNYWDICAVSRKNGWQCPSLADVIRCCPHLTLTWRTMGGGDKQEFIDDAYVRDVYKGLACMSYVILNCRLNSLFRWRAVDVITGSVYYSCEPRFALKQFRAYR
ncbi:hypothetical protein CHS0354_011299 [Potamilus streckersoni]|uniref:Uncharacterized protein n=1 Tax=Potamilus streckersoni TaxID=2493646 RepID=A0AAE0S8G3_9BIVA|nr:hypothetical protein CHS0354_011299 [Potamilus streckersoni]